MSKKASKKSNAKKTSVKKKPAPKPVKKAAKTAPAKKAPAKKPAAKKAAVSKAPAPTVLRDHAVTLARFAHGVTAKFASGFADDQVTAQPAGCKNHVLWTLGHIAATNSWLGTLIDGGPHGLPESYQKLFGYNSQPVNDPGAYPSFAEVRKAFDETFERLIGAAAALNDDQLAQPCTSDTSGFCSDKLDAVNKGAWHEGWHVGQLADLRRELGLPSGFAS